MFFFIGAMITMMLNHQTQGALVSAKPIVTPVVTPDMKVSGPIDLLLRSHVSFHENLAMKLAVKVHTSSYIPF